MSGGRNQELIDLQKGKTIDEFCFTHDGGLTMTRFQTELERTGLRGMNRNFFIGDILDVVEEAVISKKQPLGLLYIKFNDSNTAISTLFSKGITQIRVLANLIQPIVEKGKELIESNESHKLDHEIRGKLLDIAAEHIIGKGVIKKVRDIVTQDQIEKYEAEYKLFTDGTEVECEGGKKCWQYGWNEAQKLIKNERDSLYKELTELRGSISHFNTLVEHFQRIKNHNEKESKALKGYVKTLAELYDNYDRRAEDLEGWKALYRATERFRNTGAPTVVEFLKSLGGDVEENPAAVDEKLWKPFLEKYGKKLVDGKEIAALTPIQVQVESPIVALGNKLGKKFGVYIFSSGKKTVDSILRKYPENLEEVFDSIRQTYAVKTTKGVQYLIKNIQDVSSANNMPVTAKFKLYESYLPNWSINRGIELEVALPPKRPGGEPVYKKEVRVSEEKIMGERFLQAKIEMADDLYAIRRRMKPRLPGELKNKFIEVSNRLNSAEVEAIHDTLTYFLKSKKVKKLLEKNDFTFGFDVTDMKNFKIQSNFEHVYNKFTEIERLINVEALRKSDVSIKKEAYTAMLSEVLSDSGRFGIEDLKNISKALLPSDLSHFRKNKKVIELEAQAINSNRAHLITVVDEVVNRNVEPAAKAARKK